MIHSFKISRSNWSQMCFEYGENNELDSYMYIICTTKQYNCSFLQSYRHQNYQGNSKQRKKKEKKDTG